MIIKLLSNCDLLSLRSLKSCNVPESIIASVAASAHKGTISLYLFNKLYNLTFKNLAK